MPGARTTYPEKGSSRGTEPPERTEKTQTGKPLLHSVTVRRLPLWHLLRSCFRVKLSESLYPHHLEIEKTANRKIESRFPALMKDAGITENLKAADPLKWTGLMNTCHTQAEEIVLAELIYK